MSGSVNEGMECCNKKDDCKGRGFFHEFRSKKGFTYISALILIAITSIALTEASRLWKTVAKREREEELFFRGDQIRRAIASYVKSGGQGGLQYPKSFSDLLKDPRFPGIKRHLRRIYRDPMTPDGRWVLILAEGGAIKGVFSKSDDVPLKTGNFPIIYASFEKAGKYSDWKFLHAPVPLQPTLKTGSQK